MSPRRRTAIAIGVSLLAHLVFFLALYLGRSEPPPVLANNEPLNIQIVHLPPVTPPATRAPAPITRAKPPRPEHHPAHRTEHAQRSPANAGPSAPAPGTPPPTQSPRNLAMDVPHNVPQLVPHDVPGGILIPQQPPEPSHGHTIRNEGKTGPTPEEIARQDAHARQNVQGWAQDDVARDRVADGAIDSFFSDMRHALEASAKHPPPFKPKQGLSYGQAWSNEAETFGKTGAIAAGRIPKGEMRDFENHHNPIPEPGTNAELIERGLGGTTMRRHTSSEVGTGGGLVAVVEVLQPRNGKPVQVALRQSSGDKKFDAYVLEAARKGAARAPKMPAHGAGIHPEGTRSVWAFQGVISYRKSVKELKKEGKSAASIAARSALSLLGGGLGFDESKGELDVTDSTPTYRVKVALLAVY